MGLGSCYFESTTPINYCYFTKAFCGPFLVVPSVFFASFTNVHVLRVAFTNKSRGEAGTFDPICGLNNVEVINLSSNLLSGRISDSIGLLTTLKQLLLSDNKLTGDFHPGPSP